MINKNDSDTINPRKSDDVNVSCWNCVMTENDECYGTEISLSQIRKENRQRFKLYSTLASEISRPKLIPIKQKVKENYAAGKIIEKKIINNAESSVSKKTEDKNEDLFPIKQSKIEIPTIKPQDFTILVTKKEEKDNNSIVVHTSPFKPSTPKVIKETVNSSTSSLCTKEEQDSTFEYTMENVTDAQKTSIFEKHSTGVVSENTNTINSRPSDVTKNASCQDLVDNKSASNDQEDFTTSLPALNITQKKNILKTTKSLCGVNDASVRPSKSLRWSTLELPRRQNSTTNSSTLFIHQFTFHYVPNTYYKNTYR